MGIPANQWDERPLASQHYWWQADYLEIFESAEDILESPSDLQDADPELLGWAP